MGQRTIQYLAMVVALAGWGSTTQAGPVSVVGPFGSFNLQARSLQEMRWDGVVRQQYDFSCGSAAVATLLSYHYGQKTTEAEVFKTMFQEGDREKIQAQGFSMLDMKRYLDYRGLDADGFRLSLEDFVKIGVPAITLIDTQGYKHFVVVKGTDGDAILVGDPAAGTVVVPKSRFRSMWNGVVLGARAEVELARQNFNHERDWRVRPDSPLNQGVRRAGLGTMLLTLPAANELSK
ncbi:hypothetical protein SAMN02745148_00973 [Modicisalibacter ilicicola DSM 19980]|uniref:Peptidase C39 domain-containing protein n=1 Tax=Modicisalibacter ilicicola DSM 19980 TaxID=1121942 RepID=A0A1M4VU90_9GAMM|nr:C39 family peptidase [Halomonas ilicicola]SHE72641.1 hypothetical protein SAMN02745148_00973 [Halomonas ilicicola DSM 19980]